MQSVSKNKLHKNDQISPSIFKKIQNPYMNIIKLSVQIEPVGYLFFLAPRLLLKPRQQTL